MSGRTLAAVLIVMVASAVGGWMAGRELAPQPVEQVSGLPPVTVEVEEKVLETSVVTRGSVGFSGAMPLPLRVEGVVTSLPEVGGDVAHGSVLMTVDHRPVIVVESATVFTSELSEGSWGSEVRALQELLEGLGHDVGDVDGRFGESTAAAVAGWYLDLGFLPVVRDDLSPSDIDAALAFQAGEGDAVSLVQRLVERNVVVPAGRLVALPSLPMRVRAVTGRVGDLVQPGMVTVSQPEVRVVAIISAVEATTISSGAAAVIDEPGLLRPIQGTVLGKSQDPDNPSSIRVSIQPGESGDLTDLVGASVRVTFPQESTEVPVLAVPLAAVSAGHNGQGVVVVQDGGQRRRVDVELGITADGYVEVTPSGALQPGDFLIVSEAQ